uniref:Tyrosine-protein phosphatase domain-containing protein n=1 Tax=Setaria digitata TaxID=48799 RepID=A0A915PU97_9BILA
MSSEADLTSLESSIELKDSLIDTKWFQADETYSIKPTGSKWIRQRKEVESVKLQDHAAAHRPFYERWYEAYKFRALNQRLEQYAIDEMQSFIEQKLRKINDLIDDQDIKLRLISSLTLQFDHIKSDANELIRKYGKNLVCCLENVAAELSQPSSKIIEEFTNGFMYLKAVDPLSNWTEQSCEFYCRMLERINIFASSMADMVKYSFIIEPGTITPHLSEYVAEFQQLETFFERNLLSPEEAKQNAFNCNYSKVRNKSLECADISRVILKRKIPNEYENSSPTTTRSTTTYSLHGNDIVEPVIAEKQYAERSDFIHASYVRGGPLLNTFILTQAPLPSTIGDFWEMIWQQRPKYIIMLCKAVDSKRLGLLDGVLPNTCPYYWPRYENDEVQYGNYIIRNRKIDCMIDPLFNVTHLTICQVDDEQGLIHRLEHWQYDWNDFTDFYWPLRILRRARLSPTPTIVHCLDGCGRSGTLVAIEVLLMHLLRGSGRYEKLVLTTAIFVRLQRRHAIASPLQYLFIYRTLLHWMQPFITSNITRFILGLISPNWGFVGKYQKMINCRRKFQ